MYLLQSVPSFPYIFLDLRSDLWCKSLDTGEFRELMTHDIAMQQSLSGIMGPSVDEA